VSDVGSRVDGAGAVVVVVVVVATVVVGATLVVGAVASAVAPGWLPRPARPTPKVAARATSNKVCRATLIRNSSLNGR
jgi:hypothetical protein